MGFFNIFKKKGATAQTNSTEIANGNIFTKEELHQLIGNCDNIANMFANSVALRATGNGRPEKMHQTMLSYKNIFRVICKSPWIKVDMVALFLPQDVAQL